MTDPPAALCASSVSRVNDTLSLRTRMSAATISVSFTAYPCRMSDTAEPGAKSHHPWLFFLPAAVEAAQAGERAAHNRAAESRELPHAPPLSQRGDTKRSAGPLAGKRAAGGRWALLRRSGAGRAT